MKRATFYCISVIFLGILVLSWFSVARGQSLITNVDSSVKSSIKVGSTQNIKWQTSDFPVDGKVNINLIRKTSDNPLSYVLVRQLSTNTPNNGEENWSPKKDEVGNNMLIEVTCASSKDFNNGCEANTDNKIFAVRAGFSSNLANLFEVIVQFFTNIF